MDYHFSHLMSGRDSQDNAKIALVQFCLSAPKTDVCCSRFVFLVSFVPICVCVCVCVCVRDPLLTGFVLALVLVLVASFVSCFRVQLDNQVIISDYSQMDRVLKEERNYIMNMCKKIKKSGCNVLLIQKSILREAVSDQALHFLNKMKINVVKNVERDDVDYICRVRVFVFVYVCTTHCC